MNQIEIYGPLNGKNLCNIFANTIVEELKKEDPNVITEITVTDVRNFFIVRGRTNSKSVLNLTDLFSNKLNYLFPDNELSLRVIDVIVYNVSFELPCLNISKKIHKSSSEYQNFVNDNLKSNLIMKVNENFSVILFDCVKDDVEIIKKSISNNFPSYDVIKSDFSTEVYVSDDYYGMNLKSEKSYHSLIDYISQHLFHLGLCNEVNFNMFSKNNINEVDNLNCEISLGTDKNYVKKEWLESLILDVFPFELNNIIDELNLSNYDFSNKIITNNCSWEKLGRISEMVLI